MPFQSKKERNPMHKTFLYRVFPNYMTILKGVIVDFILTVSKKVQRTWGRKSTVLDLFIGQIGFKLGPGSHGKSKMNFGISRWYQRHLKGLEN
jgi:hypothetical protein